MWRTARSQSATRAKREGNDLGSGVLLMPSPDRSPTSRASLKEHKGGHDHLEIPDGDNHSSRFVALVIRHFAKKNRQRHTQPSLTSSPEQQGNGPQSSLQHNELTGVIDRPSQQLRQTAEQMFRIGLAFARWYWNTAKRMARDVVLFTIGGIYVAILMTFPTMAYAVLNWARP